MPRGILEEINAVGGGQDVGAAELAAEEGIEHGGFTCLDLAHHDEEEGLAKAGIEALERFNRLRRGLQIVRQRGEDVERGAELGAVLEVIFADHGG